MQIQVNDAPLELTTTLTLSELLIKLNISPEGSALAVNQRIVPRECWDSQHLRQNDNLIIFQAIAGG
ncbi:sulfur carrier protein ThiS [Izhakiella australiensis]|uniref:Sulfur carrier protein ThiS n=1 Tax=Izhakiella australiensis TaxID=1926881 RepID=A0A1S8Y9M5_9GAMM|nr:sulfur carrier protein ThiS [Izhakiella australiensis]OON35542.1 sulfur carrier protein ThiS [Izhakiella australiensis]